MKYVILVISFLSVNIIDAQNVIKETMPLFGGGSEGIFSYLAQTLVYPIEAKENCITGTVVVKFVIDTVGEIDSVQVTNPIHPLLNNEAIRVIKSTNGKWIPGTVNNQPVCTTISLPIKFSVQNYGCLDSEYFHNEGVSFYKKGKIEKALQNFRQAIKLNPYDVEALNNCIKIKINQKDTSGACYYVKKMTEIHSSPSDKNVEKYCK